MPGRDGFPYGGVFPTTSSVRSVLEARGTVAPHTGKPWSEAMVTGLSGGCALGYFIFEYKGYDPQVNILTRNTFHNYGWDPLAERLALVQDVQNATSPDKARDKLVAALEEGHFPVVWADVFTLGYEYSDLGEGMWAMQPVVVTSYEPGGEAVIADRSRTPITVAADLLDEARGRVKKNKHRLIVIEQPEDPDLPRAVEAGLHDTVALFTGKPPQGSASNWGIKGYDRWIKDLQKPSASAGWLSRFDTPRKRYAAMTTAYRYALTFWEDSSTSADRELYAEFLEEVAAAGVPAKGSNQALQEAASGFRKSGELWRSFGETLLPDEIPALGSAREAITKRHLTFLNDGATAELADLDERYTAAREKADSDGALGDDDALGEILANAASVLKQIRDEEDAAVQSLSRAVGQ